MRAFAATSYQIQDVSMDIRTMSRHAPRRRYGLAAALACGALAGTSATASQLTFQQALERARMDAPSLKARQTQVRAARSAADAADALPDPTLDLSLQNVPVSGPDALSLGRSEEHTSELQSLMRISYAVFCLKKKKNTQSNP